MRYRKNALHHMVVREGSRVNHFAFILKKRMCFRSRAQRMASTCFSGLQFRFIIEAGKETDEISITIECQYVFIVEYTKHDTSAIYS